MFVSRNHDRCLVLRGDVGVAPCFERDLRLIFSFDYAVTPYVDVNNRKKRVDLSLCEEAGVFLSAALDDALQGGDLAFVIDYLSEVGEDTELSFPGSSPERNVFG